jgi:hypothetical protein
MAYIEYNKVELNDKQHKAMTDQLTIDAQKISVSNRFAKPNRQGFYREQNFSG